MSDSIRYEWRRAVNRDHRLTHAERRVLFELESYANPDGTNIRPGNERVAESLLTDEHTPMSEKTVRRAVKRAQDLGYIVQTAKARRAGDTWLAAVYRLKMPVDNPTASPDTQMSGHPVDSAPITGHFESDHRTFSDHHRTSGCPDTSSINTSSDNQKEIPATHVAGARDGLSIGTQRDLERIERQLGGLTPDEAATAIHALTAGTRWNVVWSDLEKAREDARAHAPVVDESEIARDLEAIGSDVPEMTEEERDAATGLLEDGTEWRTVVRYLQANRAGKPFYPRPLVAASYDPFTGVGNPNLDREDARHEIAAALRERSIDPASLSSYELDWVTVSLNDQDMEWTPEIAAEWVEYHRHESRVLV